MIKNISIHDIDAIFFDFDGVLTNNKVSIDTSGKESVTCSRSDGLAFKAIQKLKINCFILSSETNSVVTHRSKKLKIKAFKGINNKKKRLIKLVNEKNYNLNRVVYVGNDLNDYNAMSLCRYKICPRDSHKQIKDLSDIILQSKGGEGVAREIVENIFSLNLLKILYNE